jgi:NitT/TauT family transport system permease protein
LDHAKVLGANRRALVRDVYLPAIVGSMAAILRLTAQFCLLGAVFSEIIASASGIGHEIAIAQTAQVANYLFAGVFIVAVMGFTLDRVIRRIERHFLTWRVGT